MFEYQTRHRERSRSPPRRYIRRDYDYEDDGGFDRRAGVRDGYHDRYRRRAYDYEQERPPPRDSRDYYPRLEDPYLDRLDYDRDRGYRDDRLLYDDRHYKPDYDTPHADRHADRAGYADHASDAGRYHPPRVRPRQHLLDDPPQKLSLLGPLAFGEFQNLFSSTYKVTLDDIDECVFRSLVDFDDATAQEIVAVFARRVVQTAEIKDNTAFLIGILKKFRQQGKALNSSTSGVNSSSGAGAGGGMFQYTTATTPNTTPTSQFFSKLGPLTKTGFQELFAGGQVQVEEIDEGVYKSLSKDFDDSVGLEIVNMFASAFSEEVTVKNKTGFIIGILKKYRRLGRGKKQ